MTTEADVFPLLWTEDVQALVDWAVSALGLTVAWTAPGGGWCWICWTGRGTGRAW